MENWESKVVWEARVKHKNIERIWKKKQTYGAHNESRFSVSLRKKEYQTVRHTQNPYRFSIWTGTRELNIMCASLYSTQPLYVYCICIAHNEWRNDFLPQRITHSPAKSFHSSFRFSKCKCLLFVVTDWLSEWFVYVLVGQLVWRMIDRHTRIERIEREKNVHCYAKRHGEQAATESHCSDIKRE